MRAGNKNKRIEIQQISTSKDSFGDNIETWVRYKNVWCEVREPNGKEIFNSGDISEMHHVFRIDYINGLSPNTHRLLYNGSIYDIYHVGERGFRQVTEIKAKAQGL